MKQKIISLLIMFLSNLNMFCNAIKTYNILSLQILLSSIIFLQNCNSPPSVINSCGDPVKPFFGGGLECRI